MNLFLRKKISMNYDSMKKKYSVFFSMNILFYEYVVYEFLLFYDFFLL